MVRTTLAKPAILDIISPVVTLRKSGNSFVGLCPFHAEKTPSFVVNPNRQNFRCFGCGEGGDVFDFVQKLNGTDFKGALAILGISHNRLYRPDPTLVRRRELERQFRAWEREYFNVIASEYRFLNKVLAAIQDPENVHELLKRRSILEYHLDILSSRDDAEKVALYQECGHE